MEDEKRKLDLIKTYKCYQDIHKDIEEIIEKELHSPVYIKPNLTYSHD